MNIIIWIIAGIGALTGIGAIVAIIFKNINNRKQADALINVGESQAADKDRQSIIDKAKEQIEKNKKILEENKKVVKCAKETINNININK